MPTDTEDPEAVGPGLPGARNDLTDVPGVRVGHADVTGGRALSGTTVVLAPPGGAAAAVDVRGGAPATRETDALDPRNRAPAVDALVLTGGSAFGLATAHGVMEWLEQRGRGVRFAGSVVPVVPAAALFDLGRGGDVRARPGAAHGSAAVHRAASQAPGTPVVQGGVGAGTGAVVGGVKGGVGSASTVLPDGPVVAALAVVNAAGSAVDPRTGLPYGLVAALPGDEPADPPGAGPGGAAADAGRPRVEFPLPPPGPARRAAARARLRAGGGTRQPPEGPGSNTTIGVLATDARLTPVQAQRLAAAGHDGIARAVRPAHGMSDGDTVFALATGGGTEPADAGAPDPFRLLDRILAAGADAFTRAVVRAVLTAASVRTPSGDIPSYRALYLD